MRYDAEVVLISETFAPDGIGQEIAVRTNRTVFANEFSLSHSEFYEAGSQGLKAERQYQVRSCDYADEKLLSVDGIEYAIIRVERRGEWVRLTCERQGANR